MQIQGTAPKTQTEFVSGAKNEEINSAVEQSQKKEVETPWDDKTESYQPSEEALLQFYMEQMQEQNENAKRSGEDQVDIVKLLRIAQNIMRGKQVPAKDESYLVSHNLGLYMAAKNIGSMKESTGKAKSELGRENNSVTTSSEGNSTPGESSTIFMDREGSSVTKAITVEQRDLPVFQTESNYDYSTGSGVSRSSSKPKKKYKQLRYNFKDVSSQIVKAKTSANARQAAGKARRKTTELRKKLNSSDYDSEMVRIALTHAEAIERVARKKIKHLLEEERAKRGGQCTEEDDRLMKEEQERLDEQAYLEQPDNTVYEAADVPVDGENLEELFAETVQQADIEMNISMDELMQEFAELMSESMDDMAGMEELEELTEELAGGSTADMDPEDLKMLKIKHRSKEQQEIAAADAKYLKAFFDKLQREQQAVVSGAAQIAADIVAGASSASTQIIFSGTSTATAAVETSNPGASPAVSVGSTFDASVGGDTAPAVVITEGANFDSSI